MTHDDRMVNEPRELGAGCQIGGRSAGASPNSIAGRLDGGAKGVMRKEVVATDGLHVFVERGYVARLCFGAVFTSVGLCFGAMFQR